MDGRLGDALAPRLGPGARLVHCPARHPLDSARHRRPPRLHRQLPRNVRDHSADLRAGRRSSADAGAVAERWRARAAAGRRHNLWRSTRLAATEIRIYPDGGVARLRVREVLAGWDRRGAGRRDPGAVPGTVVACSVCSTDRLKLITRVTTRMATAETKRRRGPATVDDRRLSTRGHPPPRQSIRVISKERGACSLDGVRLAAGGCSKCGVARTAAIPPLQPDRSRVRGTVRSRRRHACAAQHLSDGGMPGCGCSGDRGKDRGRGTGGQAGGRDGCGALQDNMQWRS